MLSFLVAILAPWPPDGAATGAVAASSSPAALRAPAPVEQQLGGWVHAAALAGETAFVGVGPRVAALNVGIPGTPSVLGWSAPLPAVVMDLEVLGTRAIVASHAGRIAVDISRPAAPTPLWSIGVLASKVVARDGYAFALGPASVVVVDIRGNGRVVAGQNFVDYTSGLALTQAAGW